MIKKKNRGAAGAPGVGGVAAVGGGDGVRASTDWVRGVVYRAAGRAAAPQERATRGTEGAGAAAAEADRTSRRALRAHIGVSDGGGTGRRLPDDDRRRRAADAGAGRARRDHRYRGGAGTTGVGRVAAPAPGVVPKLRGCVGSPP